MSVQKKTIPNNEDDIAILIARDDWMMGVLRIVQNLHLPDWWIGAGFVRNKVWDTLHGYEHQTPLGDIDVIYFDKGKNSEDDEKYYEQQLSSVVPGEKWSVTNQSRMNNFNNDPPYASSVDALSKWPETATCVAVKINDEGKVMLAAPHGVTDLLGLLVRPSPTFINRQEKYQARIRKKKWRDKWPKLIFITEKT